MKLAIWFLLATAIHVHSVSPHALVMVKTCGGEFATIYADKRMTIVLPNPFMANADGSYEFYTLNRCVDVEEWRTK